MYPISLAQACSFNPDLVTQACGMAAKESVLSGIDWTFSPMIDVARIPVGDVFPNVMEKILT